MVATSEAQDSALCSTDQVTKRSFVRAVRSLTVASPRWNRHQKGRKDAGEWLPDRNRC